MSMNVRFGAGPLATAIGNANRLVGDFTGSPLEQHLGLPSTLGFSGQKAPQQPQFGKRLFIIA